MIQIDLTDFELFKNFAEIKTNELYIDLHNEFRCESIKFGAKKELILSFKRELFLLSEIRSNLTNELKLVDIIFEDSTIESFSLKDSENIDTWTIDNIYRGRFEKETGVLGEISNDGRYYYYIDFCQDYSFELFAKTVKANILV